MRTTLLLVFVAAVAGFLLGLGTELLFSASTAHDRPGGSAGAGGALGYMIPTKRRKTRVLRVVIGAVCGVMGWAIYRLLFPL